MNLPAEKRTKWYQSPYILGIGVILFFVVISYAYFYPASLEGRALYQVDGAAAAGVGHDVQLLKESTGEVSRWTGSLFGGMPTYQISPSYPSVYPLRAVGEFFRLEYPIDLMLGDTYLLFMMLLGGYLFARSWGCHRVLSLLGALMWTFSSYFLILIEAGHLWKFWTLAYIPVTLAGMVLIFHRQKYLWGYVVTALSTALQIYSNHIQMSYYFAFVMLALVIAWGYNACQRDQWRTFLKSLLVTVLAGVTGVLINSSSLYHTWEYQRETMRGGREISVLDKNASSSSTNKKGLDKEYITQWSYGIDEMLTFLIPDAKGGASGYIGGEEKVLKDIPSQNIPFVAQQNRYWGDQPFTAGPVYVGAFVLLLALFGFFASRGAFKWSLFGVTLLTIMLSWGHNMMWLTNLFIDYVPLYSKFRTPSSILVVAELIIPMAAIWGLQLILRNPSVLKERKKSVIASVGLTLGVSVLLWLFPSLSGGFLSKMEAVTFEQYMPKMPQLGGAVQSLISVREAIFQADVLRTILVLLAGGSVLLLFYLRRLSKSWTLALVTLLCLVDLWSVDKRYLNDAKYFPKEQIQAKVEHTTDIDKQILQDTTQYRVLNLTVDTFSDATTSYNHRSVGGYHAAKLQRYQDVIDGYLRKLDPNILRALNTKYYIVPDSTKKGADLVVDTEAYGPAWFVKEVRKVSDANASFLALGDTPLKDIAIIEPEFQDRFKEKTIFTKDTLSHITLEKYAPNELCFKTSNSGDGLAVFSEIYYPHGWTATIDGNPAEVLRADYILRAILIPAGDHKVVLSFHPHSLQLTETISYSMTLLLLLITLLAVWNSLRVKEKGTLRPL